MFEAVYYTTQTSTKRGIWLHPLPPSASSTSLDLSLRILITEFIKEDSPFCLTRAITRTMIGPYTPFSLRMALLHCLKR